MSGVAARFWDFDPSLTVPSMNSGQTGQAGLCVLQFLEVPLFFYLQSGGYAYIFMVEPLKREWQFVTLCSHRDRIAYFSCTNFTWLCATGDAVYRLAAV